MDTKWGITALVVGGYLMAVGIAGINANSGGAVALFSVLLVLGFVIGGWSVVLPWGGRKARGDHDSPGPVPRG